jgi:hypothetical protein
VTVFNCDAFLARLFRAALPTAAMIVAGWPLVVVSALAGERNNPVGKVYFTDVAGGAQIGVDGANQDLTKRSLHRAEGSVIETSAATADGDRNAGHATMVFSNGTGLACDPGTRIEVRKFEQDWFRPTRADMDVEPSISHVEVFVDHGVVAVSTSVPVAGSSRVYQTRDCSIIIRSREVVIETGDNGTKLSVLEGVCILQGGDHDRGGHIVRAGEQALVRSGRVGTASLIEVSPIPSGVMQALRDRVDTATLGKKTVYFEVKETTAGAGAVAVNRGEQVAATGTDTASGSSNDPATPFADGARQEVFASAVVPSNLPVQFTVSPARLPGR